MVRIFFILLLLIGSWTSLYAQWTASGGPVQGVQVWDMASSGTTVFAATNLGAFVSTSNGQSWSAINTGLPSDVNLRSIAASGTTLYAGTQIGTVFTSTSSGQSWTSMSTGLPASAVRSLFIGSNFLLAGTEAGIFRSTNNGQTWTATTGLPTGTQTTRLYQFGTTLLAATNNGIYASSDNGVTWAIPATGGSGIASNSIGSITGGIIQIGSDLFTHTSNGYYRSTNNGQSWTTVSTTGLNATADALTLVGTTPTVGTRGGRTVFTLSGTTWIPASGLPVDGAVLSLLVVGSCVFAGLNGHGIFISENNGTSFRESNRGFPSLAEVTALTTVGDALYAALEGIAVGRNSGGVYASLNTGASWSILGTSPNASLLTGLFSLAVRGRVMLAGDGGGVWRSADLGETWARANTGIPAVVNNDDFNAMVFVGDNHVVAATGNGFLFSRDAGQSWNVPTTGNPTVSARALLVLANGRVLGATSSGVFRSADTGRTWTATTLTQSTWSLIAIGNRIFAGLDLGDVRTTTDEGATWTGGRIPNVSSTVRALATSGSVLFAAASEGVFASTNNGSTWTNASTGLPTIIPLAMVATSSALFIGGRGSSDRGIGVWQRPLIQLSTRESRPERPTAFMLEQNYPNPFNPTTVIEYELPTSSQVSLKIFDVLGREVATLVSARQEAGRYAASFNASGLTSGMYFYQLQAGTFVQTKKMLLIK
jgi:hypothetical protein